MQGGRGTRGAGADGREVGAGGGARGRSERSGHHVLKQGGSEGTRVRGALILGRGAGDSVWGRDAQAAPLACDWAP